MSSADVLSVSSSTAIPNFPFAAAPDIIRAHQKDAYFQAVLLEQLSTLTRSVYGARFVHTYTTELRTLADTLYHALTTLVGNRTLGEEYCDIVQVEHDTVRLPHIARRAGYILTSILVPYGLNKVLPALRRRVRTTLESHLNVPSRKPGSRAGGALHTTRRYLLDNLDTLTSPSPLYAVSLAVFYFSGAYYQLAKRLCGLRYIFSRQVAPSDQRVGYEVLGVLLVAQLSVQAYLHMRNTVGAAPAAEPELANAAALAGPSIAVGGGVEVSLDHQAYTSNNALLFESDAAQQSGTTGDTRRLAKVTHTPAAPHPRFHLEDREVMQWIPTKQQRKCTLCLEELKDPSVSTCGHVFCWNCISDWLRERPECPLCRSQVAVQHVLPLRG